MIACRLAKIFITIYFYLFINLFFSSLVLNLFMPYISR